jgi:tungstate transport system substrate-binding protein
MSKTPRIVLLNLAVILVLVLSACAPAATAAPTQVPTTAPAVPATQAPTTVPPTSVPTVPPTQAPTAFPTPANPNLILATTTSTRDTGLLDVLLPMFKQQTGYDVKMVAVGSGAALQLGIDGNADVLLVHSPAAEKDLMSKGFGKERTLVMHNDFVIVGPSSDPASIKSATSAIDAFKKIAAAQATFASRNDKSGTNTMELSLWKSAAITPAGTWYLQTGQGMADTLRIISEKAGYTLTDRGTYIAQQKTLSLDILYEGDPALLNIYHVITVDPAKWPKVNYTGAKAFADWLVSPAIQDFIGKFGVDKYGKALFFPDAGKPDN